MPRLRRRTHGDKKIECPSSSVHVVAMLRWGSKLAWFLGLAALLMLLHSADGRRHNLRSLHRARHPSDEARPLVPADEDHLLVRHPRREENNYEEDEDDYRDEDSFDEDDSAEYEEIPRVPPRRRLQVGRKMRHRQQHRLPPMTGKFDEVEDPMNLAREQHSSRDHRSRGKRLTQRRHWTDKDRESFERRPLPIDHEHRDFELEVREAQNSSLCNYTVIPIPDPGGRIPRELEHVKCNHVGSRCQERGPYCCIQTYRFIEVVYDGSRTDKIKVYSGCVCSLQIYGTLEPYTPELEINY